MLTRSATGELTIYIDGERRAREAIAGAANWESSFALLLGNDQKLDRPWRGTYRLLAVYGRALREDEVAQNYAADEA